MCGLLYVFMCHTESEEAIPYTNMCLHLPLQKKPAVSLLRSTEELARSGFVRQDNQTQDHVADSNIGEGGGCVQLVRVEGVCNW